MSRQAFAVAVVLELGVDVDPRAPGGEITVALCGSWRHDGPCRWPHNTSIDTTSAPVDLRTVVVVPGEERAEVVRRIDDALRLDARWQVVDLVVGEVRDDERPLVERLAAG